MIKFLKNAHCQSKNDFNMHFETKFQQNFLAIYWKDTKQRKKENKIGHC